MSQVYSINISTKYQAIIYGKVEIQSSDLSHFLPASIILKSTQLMHVRLKFWHQEVMAKRIMMGVWKVKKKGSNNGEGNHKTRGRPVVDTV